MPIFLERMILPALAALLIILAVTNPLDLSPMVRVIGALAVLAIGCYLAFLVRNHNDEKAKGKRDTTIGSDGRIFIKHPPLYLLYLCKDITAVEASRLMKPYFGKWLYVSGRLDDVHEYGGKWHVAVDIVTGIKGLTAGFRQADLTFDSTKWADYLGLLAKGSPVYAIGVVREFSSFGVVLENCELVAKGD